MEKWIEILRLPNDSWIYFSGEKKLFYGKFSEKGGCPNLDDFSTRMLALKAIALRVGLNPTNGVRWFRDRTLRGEYFWTIDTSGPYLGVSDWYLFSGEKFAIEADSTVALALALRELWETREFEHSHTI